MAEIPLTDWLRSMVRRVPPEGSPVVAGSTPVVAFGDPARSTVATLGINPSAAEFVRDGVMLSGPDRRLSTLESLDCDDLAMLDDDQVRLVISDCANYFHANPYTRWFNPLEHVLQGLGVSYFTDTACHLDLVQWATDPIWGRIPDKSVRIALLEDGLPHLRNLVAHCGIHTILLNGALVLEQVQRAGLVELCHAGELALGQRRYRLMTGASHGVQWFGWSANLQSSFGISSAFKTHLRDWIAGVATSRPPEPGPL
jgi:hypothetical protein